jgi:hypothetical protein
MIKSLLAKIWMNEAADFAPDTHVCSLREGEALFTRLLELRANGTHAFSVDAEVRVPGPGR